MSKRTPIKFAPVFKDYIWGGTKLKTLYNKKCKTQNCAESWELSTHKDGESVVLGGEYDGLKFSEYIKKIGEEILGENAKKFDYFPILIKLIDAQKDLSVQVHPDDEYALRNEGEYGKTEMWYVLECDEHASLYYGFSKNVTKQEYEDSIKNNTLTQILNKVPVHKGDVFFVSAGTVHAIGAGIIICEIQQNSNTTYRVYDYNRRDKDGNTRQLHIEKAIEVSDLRKAPDVQKIPDSDETVLAKCEYFTVRKLNVSEKTKQKIDTSSFRSIIVTDGAGKLSMNSFEMEIKKGDSIFIPAQDGFYEIIGSCEIIITYI